MNSFGSNLRRREFWYELISFRSLVVVSPVFLLTVKHWINLVVLFAFVGSLFFLLQKQKPVGQEFNKVKRWRWIIALTLVGPVFAVGMGQLLRGEFYPPNFDAPLRIALCAPVFLAISFGWLNSETKEHISTLWMKYFIPASLLWTFIYRPSWSDSWGGGRITTYFVDVLSFGSLTLLFSLLSITSLTFFWSKYNKYYRLLILISVFTGFYLSIMSGSRTGWLFLPFFLFIWLRYFAFKQYGIRKALLIFFLIFLSILIIISFHPNWVDKMKLIYSEIASYHWNSLNEDNSVGMRISFYRMAFFYFFENPFKGWGDLGWIKLSNTPEITQYASEFTRDFARKGFHNEIFTNAVRSGIWGLFTSIALLIIPIVFAINIRNRNVSSMTNDTSIFLVIFMTHMLLAGMTTEVTNLVYLSSFFGITLSVYSGDIINSLTKKAFN